MTKENRQVALRHLVSEEARRQTFTHWPFGSRQPCSARKIAEAGFVFIGSSREPDSVRCCFCFKSLDGWESTDDPWSEHLKHAPNCQFAQMQKPQDLWTWQELVHMIIEYEKNAVRQKYEQAGKDLKKESALIMDFIEQNKR